MAKYGADALRLWATQGRIGTDLRYNEKDIGPAGSSRSSCGTSAGSCP